MQFLQKLPDNFEKEENKVYIAIVGSRNIEDYDFVREKFEELLLSMELEGKELVVVSGGARGVDSIAKRIAKEFKLEIIEILPDWKRLGKSAGIKRNSEIVKISDVMLAVPEKTSKGTWDSIRKAKKKGIPVYVYAYGSDKKLTKRKFAKK